MKRVPRSVLEFTPGLLSIQESPPAPLPRVLLQTVVALSVVLIAWASMGKLDIIASAEGRLVPRSYLKIVQPADAGIVKDILVHEGDHVRAGQVLLRMDPVEAQADAKRLSADYAMRTLQLRRINAELTDRPLRLQSSDPVTLYQEVNAQFKERQQSYRDARRQAEEELRKAKQDWEAGRAVLEKLAKTTPILRSQADSYESLGKDGYVPQVTVAEKKRLYVESSQDLVAQSATVDGLEAAVRVAQQELDQVVVKYRADLQNERLEATSELAKLEEERTKQAYRSALLELTAPQAGIVKDIATHTIGTVVSAGTVLLSVVPDHEPLMAEIMIRNDDVGFVRAGQRVKVKLIAYPFQKYGMLQGNVLQVWPDADEAGAANSNSFTSRSPPRGGYLAESGTAAGFKALVSLEHQRLDGNGQTFELLPGMQVLAEIQQGRRTVLEYLLSPVQRALHEGGQER